MPGALVERVGRTHWVRSLGTGYRDEAVRRARIAAADFERMLLEAEGRSDPADHRRIIPAKRSEPALPVRPERTFRDLFDLFMADPSRTRVRKTDMVYETLFDMASGLWGADRPLRAIDREACRDLLDLLRWLGTVHINWTLVFAPKKVLEYAWLDAHQGGLNAAFLVGR